ncbi:hypothetical protein Scep_012333 [Stephania cephalantha]|uniref:Uncharacterized protein n=1 Tax=Stephania cephalantha TaxID=152367 RepID=A0AAP0P9F3_9MAGN
MEALREDNSKIFKDLHARVVQLPLDHHSGLTNRPRTFIDAELRTATGDFDRENKLGAATGLVTGPVANCWAKKLSPNE